MRCVELSCVGSSCTVRDVSFSFSRVLQSDVIDFFIATIPTGRNYDFINVVLNRFLLTHGLVIKGHKALQAKATTLRDVLKIKWTKLDDMFNEVRAAITLHSGVQDA